MFDASLVAGDNTAVSQKSVDAFQQLQKRATETITAFTTTPQVSSTGSRSSRGATNGATNNNNNNNNNAAAGGGEAAIETMPLDDLYDMEYSADMTRRWADYDDDVYGSDVNHDDESDEDDGMARQRRHLFGSTATTREPNSDTVMHSDDDDDDDPNPRARKRPRNAVDQEQQRQPYDTRNRQECFLCAWGNKYHDGIEAPHINKLHNIISQNYSVHHNKEIAKELHMYFMDEIYDPELGMGILTPEIALEHIEQLHTLDARIFVGETIKTEKKLAYLFQNRICRANGTLDKESVTEYRKSIKVLCQLYRMPLDKMNFNNGNSAEDLRRAANYMQLMPRFEQLPPSAPKQRTGGSRRLQESETPRSRKTFS
jgi:hypothetical protein